MTPFWRNWMQVWCWGTLGFGVVLAGGAFAALDGPTRLVYDFVYWPIDGASPFDDDLRFTVGVLGAVMIGWALTIFALVKGAETADRATASTLWRGFTLAMVAWYVIDSTVSVATGAAMNAASNTVFLATYLIGVFGGRVLKGAPPARA